jgi:chromosomal replication initiation ATPase DnaA
MTTERNPQKIIQYIEAQYGLTPGSLIKQNRRKYVVKARKEAAQRMKNIGMSDGDIGDALHRDRSTIAHYRLL